MQILLKLIFKDFGTSVKYIKLFYDLRTKGTKYNILKKRFIEFSAEF